MTILRGLVLLSMLFLRSDTICPDTRYDDGWDYLHPGLNLETQKEPGNPKGMPGSVHLVRVG
jgi:hypothetical protein